MCRSICKGVDNGSGFGARSNMTVLIPSHGDRLPCWADEDHARESIQLTEG
jgi:hypothetical protein